MEGINRDKKGSKHLPKIHTPHRFGSMFHSTERAMVFSPTVERFQAIPEPPQRPQSAGMRKWSCF